MGFFLAVTSISSLKQNKTPKTPQHSIFLLRSIPGVNKSTPSYYSCLFWFICKIRSGTCTYLLHYLSTCISQVGQYCKRSNKKKPGITQTCSEKNHKMPRVYTCILIVIIMKYEKRFDCHRFTKGQHII